jgi:Uma2 family endonuclease
MATTESLLTAEDFQRMPHPGYPTELVRGRIIEMTPPGFRHGRVSSLFSHLLWECNDQFDVGHTVSESGVITKRDPDSVRGPDVSFYTYAKVPKDADPTGYPAVVPDLVFEARSPGDRPRELLDKVDEYLQAGVLVVCIADPETRTVTVFRAGQPKQVLSERDELVLPEVHRDFRVPVRRLFS